MAIKLEIFINEFREIIQALHSFSVRKKKEDKNILIASALK